MRKPLLNSRIFEDSDYGIYRSLSKVGGSFNYEKNSKLPYWKLKLDNYLTGQLFKTSGPAFTNRLKVKAMGSLR